MQMVSKMGRKNTQQQHLIQPTQIHGAIRVLGRLIARRLHRSRCIIA
jgi:hypothetical protein